MPENCAAAVDPWSWMSDAFARETEALTRALQISISNVDSSVSILSPVSVDALSSSSSSPPLLIDLIKPEPTASPPNPNWVSKRPAVVAPPVMGRISKRKSRASKRFPTTYINADPANFREMVQQVTGVRLGDAKLPVEPVLKPEPQRAGGSRTGVLLPGCLPTLDTSAFLLDRAGVVEPEPEAPGSIGPVVDGSVGFEFVPFPSYPTLESWGVN